MPIEHFKIVNDDQSINQSEYERCIQFLNDYIAGTVKVYQQLSWANPLEIDMSQEKPANVLLTEILSLPNNKLLTKSSFDNIKKLFKGLVDYYGSTIHTYGRYLEASKDFKDGYGYMYDVLKDKSTEVKSYDMTSGVRVYYLVDDNHTVVEYNDLGYAAKCLDETLPNLNYPDNLIAASNVLQSNVNTYPNVYKGYLSGVYSDFQRLSGQYIGSSTLFYYSQCNDILYTTGGNSYSDSRVNEIINFNRGSNVKSKSKPTRGVDVTRITELQNQVQNYEYANAYIEPSVINRYVNYLSPIFFTSQNDVDWIIV